MDEKEMKELEERLRHTKVERNYHFHRPVGQFIEHVDTVNFSMDKDGEFHFENVGQVNGRNNKMAKAVEENVEENVEEDTRQPLIEQLKPIFYNKESDVRKFLKEIARMKPKDITDLVNRWVTEKRISDYGNSRKGVLWEILHEAGLYKPSRQNWDKRVF